MKFNYVGKQPKCWHLWFAWYPVRLNEKDCRWLEKVWRRGNYWSLSDVWEWEYEARWIK